MGPDERTTVSRRMCRRPRVGFVVESGGWAAFVFAPDPTDLSPDIGGMALPLVKPRAQIDDDD
jgi:hypothetical protein